MPAKIAKRGRPLAFSDTPMSRWMDRLALSPERVAKMTGINLRTVYALRRGQQQPTVDQAVAIKRASRGVVPVECWKRRIAA